MHEPTRWTSGAVLAAATLYVIAIALWLGGLVVLGAIVAPTVFRIVPAPTSADAMTVVFHRFDAIATGAAVVALVCEAVLAMRGGKVSRLDVLRAAALVVAAAAAITEALWLTPTIEALHRAGAIRGFGEAGLALERWHRVAESAAKGELFLLLLVVVLFVVKLTRRREAASDIENRGTPV
jgi:uncharacterized membrane protein